MPTQLLQKDLSTGGTNTGAIRKLNVMLSDDNRMLMFQLVIAKPIQPTGSQDMSVDINEAQAEFVLRLCGIRGFTDG